MCAEVLVPDRVAPRYIAGAYVASPELQAALSQRVPRLQVAVNRHLFFQG
jgi:hypothetical protein